LTEPQGSLKPEDSRLDKSTITGAQSPKALTLQQESHFVTRLGRLSTAERFSLRMVVQPAALSAASWMEGPDRSN